jgi:hypothetical protein
MLLSLFIAPLCQQTGKSAHCQALLPGGTMQLANKKDEGFAQS